MQTPSVVFNIGTDVSKDEIVAACAEGTFPLRGEFRLQCQQFRRRALGYDWKQRRKRSLQKVGWSALAGDEPVISKRWDNITITTAMIVCML